MPPPFLERVALELLRIFVLVVLVLVAVQADDLELQAQRANVCLHSAHIDWAQRHRHITKLQFLHVTRRLWRDRPRHVGRAFGQLSAAVMLNARLARGANFTSMP